MDKRQAVGGLGRAALLAAGVTAAARAQDRTVGLGLVGLGGHAQGQVARAAQAVGWRIVSAWDTTPAALAGLPAGITAQPSLQRLLADPAVTAVLIDQGGPGGRDLARQALRAGKHVALVPPVVNSVEAGEELLRAAQEAGVIVAVGHAQRGAATVREGVRRARAGAVGAIHTARAIWFEPAVAGGGTESALDAYAAAALDTLDTARWLLGGDDLPEVVRSGPGRRAKSAEIGQNIHHVVYTLADKRSLAIEIRRLPSPDENGLRRGAIAYGADGWLSEADGFAPHRDYNGKGALPADLAQPELPGAVAANWLDNFAAAVLEGRPEMVNCPLLAGVRTAQFLALARSAAERPADR